jgi:hypothetical protein
MYLSRESPIMYSEPLSVFSETFRPKIKHCLFPLYLPTQQTAPTRPILFANFKSKYNFFHFAPQKSKLCPILLHLHTHFVKQKIKDCLPTYLLYILRGQ